MSTRKTPAKKLAGPAPKAAKAPAKAAAKPQAKASLKAGAAAAAAAAATPSHARTVLKKLSAHYAAITPEDEAALLSLATEAQCADLGAATRAEGVLGDSVRWAAQIDDSLRAYPDALAGYSATRFMFYLGRVGALADAIDAQRARRSKKGQAQGGALSERQAAKDFRAMLLNRLQSVAGLRDAERREIDAAEGTTETDDALARSLMDLSAVADRWLKRADADSIALAKIAGLSPDHVSEARKRAKALAAASADVTLQPGVRPQDAPAVNVAEGRVLLEMKEARRLFAEAKAIDSRVPKLSPGPATRHVFNRSSRKSGAAAAEQAAEGRETHG